MNLSAHFTVKELSRSRTADRQGLKNVPNVEQLANLKRLATEILEPIRALFGLPMSISSGYRALLVNAAVGGKSDSAHLEGRAADFTVPGVELELAFATIKGAKSVDYDQIIIEHTADKLHFWLHVAIARLGETPRREALTYDGEHYRRIAVG